MDNAGGVSGVGLGLRREFLKSLIDIPDPALDFLELAPENWLGMGGWRARYLKQYAQRFPIICHGLSLSLGGPKALDATLLSGIKTFLSEYQVPIYSEHLSYCSDDKGYLYELMPIPFTQEAVRYTAERIRQVQDFLGRRIAVENVSYYMLPSNALSEIDFLCAVLEEADCDLLLDVNNVYVNSQNHGYHARDFIAAVPADRVCYLHVAGHTRINDELIIDTHAAAVVDDVWSLLEYTYQTIGVKPTLLERDDAVPELSSLLAETRCIAALQAQAVEAGTYPGQSKAVYGG